MECAQKQIIKSLSVIRKPGGRVCECECVCVQERVACMSLETHCGLSTGEECGPLVPTPDDFSSRKIFTQKSSPQGKNINFFALHRPPGS